MTITTEEALLLERAAVFAESFVIDAAEDDRGDRDEQDQRPGQSSSDPPRPAHARPPSVRPCSPPRGP